MFNRINRIALARLLPPSLYVSRMYRKKTGERLNLNNPLKFNEKLQWLKLNYRNPILMRMADKYEAKKVVRERLGSDRSVPTAAIFDSPDQIRLDDLPDALALKATHGSGWNIISRDKSELDEDEVQSYFRFWLGKSYYRYSKEWAYKYVRPRVICEPLLKDEHGDLPLDYKIFCFGGQARFVQVDFDRFTNHTRSFYDLDWNKLDFSFGYPMSDKKVSRPVPLEKMVKMAEKIASGLPFLRVDFFVHQDHPYVGELTFYPENGLGKFTDEAWNLKLGDLLTLPSASESLNNSPRQPTA